MHRLAFRVSPILWCILVCLAPGLARADAAWDGVLARARGQTVFWNAWGGDERTNAFIRWVGEETKKRYGVEIRHVKLAETAEAVNRVLAEKEAGRIEGGSIDLIWINGPNFLAMKEKGLLFGPFVTTLPNARYLDLSPSSPAAVDFTVPVEGYESPWRLARFVFMHDGARVARPPASMAALADWAAANPGRFTHPTASNFLGATFLKQALIELAPDPALLQRPATDDTFDTATAPLWTWYDRLRPNLWRGGRDYPSSGPALERLLSDGEIDIAMSFDPAAAAAGVAEGRFAPTTRTFTPAAGTIGNVSFVAIPFNAAHRDAAQVVADFLLDPATQARAEDITVLGSLTVLDRARLTAEQRALFAALPSSPALPDGEALGRTLLEPHPSWMTRLARAWAERYTK